MTAAEEITVVVEPELLTQEIQCKRIDTGINERHAKPNNLEDVPEEIVEPRVEVVPHGIDVTR